MEAASIATLSAAATANLNANFTPAILPRDFCGPAIVYRQASAFPAHFSGRTADQIGQVADIPVGNLVFCLPITSEDVEWRPVIIEIAKSNGATDQRISSNVVDNSHSFKDLQIMRGYSYSTTRPT